MNNLPKPASSHPCRRLGSLVARLVARGRQNRHLKSLILGISSLLALGTSAFAQLPNPCYGWNIGNTLELWDDPAPTQALINSAASSGFNAVRIPCAWYTNSDKNTYQINASYMAKVKQTVDWCLGAGMTVVINDHWDYGWMNDHLTGTVDPTINAMMNSYWSQIATTFAGYNNRLLFAAANEPPADTPAKVSELMTYYQTFINAVRSKGGNNSSRWLVIQGPGTDIDATDTTMNTLPSDPTPGRLMVEIHYYTPFQFTLMGADQSWGNMFFFWGTGYHSTTMPSRNATWGEEAYMDSEFQKMTNKFVNHGIPVIVGEFGAYKRRNLLSGADYDLNYASTTYFNKSVVASAHRHGLSPFFWNTPGYLFDWTTGAFQDRITTDSVTGRGALPVPATDGSPVRNGTYKIAVRNSGKALDAAGWGTANGTQIQQWTYLGGNNQLWTVTNRGNNQYSIIGVQSGKAIDINGWDTADGTKVQLWDYSGGNNQKFTFTATGGGYYRITPVHAPNSCLDLSSYSSADGAAVQLWTYGGGENQQWVFQIP
jgi:hypothetical protein